ncbi:LysR family transcriptional regulator [Variovorax saccharolyticus]|uniref:LysR substrate-binding domain-containing protein n=1 Tax=Variovorax saccharolyticus TaxID=3053516 RepID=UPI0025782C1A|nr:LysR family transcriptional regulator [Variovorax sp. J31P216]MDM0026322.1 LysR family transcriptional regulator [Variovorax sp. J31P216]
MDHLLALRVFVRIAESGSFTKAADSLNLPKPTVTRQIQDLETHLGVKLLQRTTRKVSVTPEGASYYEKAVRVLADVEEMDASAAKTRAKPKGRLRVDIGSSLANLILIPALPGFRQRYPDMQVDLGVSDRPTDLISEGVDCVIRGGALADSSLVARRIAELEYVTCASPSYLKQYGRPTHPRDLAQGHVHINYFSSLTGRPFPLHFRRGDEAVEVAGRAAISVNESTAHLTALLSGLGVSQTFKFMVRPYVERGELVPLLSDWTRPRHPLNILYPPTRQLNARLRVFVDWSAEVFKEFDWPTD